MRDLITTIAEILGAVSIAAGMAIIFGLGASLIVSGCFLIVGSFLYSRGDE